MSFERPVYKMWHVLWLTGMVAGGTALIYLKACEEPALMWFMENWGLYIGITCTILMFLYGLSILGTPCYDEETNKQLEREELIAQIEWNSKSPEERAIITAAKRNELLQLTQILQNNQIIQNQEQLKKKLRT